MVLCFVTPVRRPPIDVLDMVIVLVPMGARFSIIALLPDSADCTPLLINYLCIQN